MRGGDHAGARKLRRRGKIVDLKAHQIRKEEEESTAWRRERAGVERKVADIGDGFHGWSRRGQALLVEPPRQASEALFAEHLAHGGGAQRVSGIPEGRADFVDGVVLLAQHHWVFRLIVTGRFGIVTGRFGNVTGDSGGT